MRRQRQLPLALPGWRLHLRLQRTVDLRRRMLGRRLRHDLLGWRRLHLQLPRWRLHLPLQQRQRPGRWQLQDRLRRPQQLQVTEQLGARLTGVEPYRLEEPTPVRMGTVAQVAPVVMPCSFAGPLSFTTLPSASSRCHSASVVASTRSRASGTNSAV